MKIGIKRENKNRRKKPGLVSAVIVAAGSSRRMGGTDKLAAPLAGSTVIAHTIRAFQESAEVGEIVLVLRQGAERSALEGASGCEKLSRIVLPLAKNGFISGFMLTFISIAKELDLIIIMMDKKTQTMSYLAFTYSQEGYNQMADAISVCVLFFILVCYIVANRFGADIGKSW